MKRKVRRWKPFKRLRTGGKESVCKRVFSSWVVIVMVVAIATNAVITTNVNAESSSTLGTQEAIGSPILNSDFTTNSWDTWEMITFGIYLSNYCQPLVDSYESAFSTSAGYGSEGEGLEALEFGSGNDPDNNEVIASLLTQAISYQNSVEGQTIYVSYTPIEDGVLGESQDPNNGGTVREAVFSDLFLSTSKPEDSTLSKSWADTGNNALKGNLLSVSTFYGENYEDYTLYSIGMGNLPTFYVKSGSTYIKILDYTNSWDIQIVAAMLNVVYGSDYEDTFYSNYNSMYGEEEDGSGASKITFDSFGNIVCKNDGANLVVIPASVNQHLTTTDQVNLLNSWILNGTTSSLTEDNLVKNGRQVGLQEAIDFPILSGLSDILSTTKGTIYSSEGSKLASFGGVPAFGSRTSDGTLKDGSVVLYKDTDTIMYSEGNSDNLGQKIISLMENASLDSSLTLKVEAVNESNISYDKDSDASGALHNTIGASSMLSNMLDSDIEIGLDSIELPYTNESKPMFTSTVMVSNQMKSTGKDSTSNYAITRALTEYIYKIYSEGKVSTTYGDIDRETLLGMLEGCDTAEDMCDLYSTLYNYYKSGQSGFSGVEYDPNGEIFTSDDDLMYAYRYTIVQVPSDLLSECAKVLGMEEGTESYLYSTYIYATYLKFYGINSGSTLGADGGNTTNLNKDLFSTSAATSYDITEIQGLISDEQKQKEVLDMSYLILSDSESGTSYRNSLNTSDFSTFLSEQYNRIVYGGNSGSTIVTNNDESGFLNVSSIEDNPFTSWIISGYSSIAVWLILLILVIIVVVGVLLSKHLSWFIGTIFLSVNIVVLLPTIANIAPAVSNQVVQWVFDDKMTFWGISEQVSESNTEKQLLSSETEDTELASLVKSLNIVSSDSSLVIKKDISSKITTKLSETYESIQQLSTARWLLPVLMQQISGEDSEDYVYTTMANLFDDATNMYLYYNDEYSGCIETVAAQSDPGSSVGEPIKASDRKANYYGDYLSTNGITSVNGINYRHIGYEESSYDTMSHTYFYLLEATDHTSTALSPSTSSMGVDYSDIESYQNYIDQSISMNCDAWNSTLANIEETADQYERTERSSIDQSYGYLWNSESVFNYMYETVEDSFSSSESVGSVIGKLQGTYEEDAEGNEVRSGFMFATDVDGNATGYTRDILDLEEFFTNNMQYMYKMWLTAGGFDGDSGVFGDQKIEGSTYYDENNASWYFRCNWAIKLMENEELNGSATVYDSEGNKYTVENMLIPQCYPSTRPMIFSRAQEEAYGLTDSDLSYVELKCVNLNEETMVDWTSLINYSGVSGINKEILMRQMALDATFNFNEKFSTTALSSSSKALYPTSLDMRTLSFDSVMKMVILNITKDSSYVYGSTVSTVIYNTDAFTGICVVLAALLCASIVPLARNIAVATLFILCIVSLVFSFLSRNQYKVKVILGMLMGQCVVIFVNTVYYLCFGLMVKTTNVDEVLSVSTVKSSVSSGNPLWAMLIIILIGVAYVIAMFLSCKMFIKHRRDMGFQLYTTAIQGVAGKISDAVEGIRGRVGEAIDKGRETKEGALGSARSFIGSHRGYDEPASVENEPTAVKLEQGEEETIKTSRKENNDNHKGNRRSRTGYYKDVDEKKETSEKDEINKEIEKGSQK